MGSNARRNKAAMQKYRKELNAMIGDIREIDKKVLNRAVNVGLREAKNLTPTGNYSNQVNFTTSDGKVVSFYTNKVKQGGFMKKHWFTEPITNNKSSIEKKLFNTAKYASYVNYGHRIVRKGITLGFVNGKFILERVISKVEKCMVNEFEKEIEEVNKKHGDKN